VADRVGAGVRGDAQLLVPELRLLALDSVVELRLLVAECLPLLAELQHACGEQGGADGADEKLGHKAEVRGQESEVRGQGFCSLTSDL
jgi:hypothetical protein